MASGLGRQQRPRHRCTPRVSVSPSVTRGCGGLFTPSVIRQYPQHATAHLFQGRSCLSPLAVSTVSTLDLTLFQHALPRHSVCVRCGGVGMEATCSLTLQTLHPTAKQSHPQTARPLNTRPWDPGEDEPRGVMEIGAASSKRSPQGREWMKSARGVRPEGRHSRKRELGEVRGGGRLDFEGSRVVRRLAWQPS